MIAVCTRRLCTCKLDAQVSFLATCNVGTLSCKHSISPVVLFLSAAGQFSFGWTSDSVSCLVLHAIVCFRRRRRIGLQRLAGSGTRYYPCSQIFQGTAESTIHLPGPRYHELQAAYHMQKLILCNSTHYCTVAATITTAPHNMGFCDNAEGTRVT